MMIACKTCKTAYNSRLKEQLWKVQYGSMKHTWNISKKVYKVLKNLNSITIVV